jgi:hypothetical protein
VPIMNETRELYDRFFELVLSDPDLLDIEFVAVLASYNARPPSAPPKTAQRAGSGVPGCRALRPVDLGPLTGSYADRWQLTAARAPPRT